MKKRLKSWISSIIGGVIMALSTIAIMINMFGHREDKFSILSIVLGFVLGYIFLMGKDEWIKELFDELKNLIPGKK